MLIAIIMATALSGTALVEEADRRTLAYTECLFAQVRAAREESLPEQAMLSSIENACQAERIALESVMIDIGQERGETRAEAQANWDRVHANSIEAVRRAYALRHGGRQG